MVSQQICSLQHPLVKRWVKLRENHSFRQEEQKILLTGHAVIQETYPTIPVECLISTVPVPIPAQTRYLVSPQAMQKIIGHPTTDLVAAEISMPSFVDFENKKKIVLLDGISDPGNLGTIFRTALGLGWEGIFVIHQSVDPYNDKALRASKGAVIRMPWKLCLWQDVLAFMQKRNYQMVVADTEGTAFTHYPYKSPLILVLGHETKGPSQIAKTHGHCITIPMKNQMESLNVASAASILLYHIQERSL